MTSGTKLNIMITGQEQYISTIGNNMVQVTAQQDQPLLRAFLSTNGGVTIRTEAVVRPHEDKKSDGKRVGIRSGRRTAPSVPSFVSRSCCTRNRPRSCRRLGTSRRQQQQRLHDMGKMFPPEGFATLSLFRQTPDE